VRADPRSRRGAREVVDAAIVDWTRQFEPEEVEARLQACGVPVHVVLDTPGLFACPQLRHREPYLEIEHAIYQTTSVESSRLRFSRSRARVPQRALHLGRDNRQVLESILGYSAERIDELEHSGVLS
jgi:crotonobetainyl-CoA:carnitine CoA-transferase CaiB-like acyl-CoA transferase